MSQDAYQERKWYDASVSGPLSAQERAEFLAGNWLLKLAVTKDDGWPYVVPLWYLWQDEAFWLVGRKRSEWVQDLLREPRCAACVEEKEIPPDGGNRKVLAQCTAEVIEGPVVAEGSQWVEIANAMALRYVGPEGPEALSRSYGWERYLVKLVPRDGRLTTFQGVDWHRRYFEPGQRPDLEEQAELAAERRSSA